MNSQLASLLDARQKLPALAEIAQSELAQFLNEHRGTPASVLSKIPRYHSLKASVELLQRPDVIDNIVVGIKAASSGDQVSIDAVFQKEQAEREAHG
jgi:hypothetical protein